MSDTNQSVGAEATSGGTVEAVAESITLSQKELELRVQSQVDKRVAQALVTNSTKLQQQFEERLVLEREEATKLAKMTADQKAEFEAKKYAETLSKKEADLKSKEIKLQTIEFLSKSGLELDSLDFVLGADEVETQTKLDKLNLLIDKRVAKEKESWIKSNSSESVKTNNNTGVQSTKTEFTRAELTTAEGRKAFAKAGDKAKIVE
jgi:hypothetical protein